MSDRIEKIKTFLKTSPRDCFLHHALALEYIKTGDDISARSQFETNLAIDPAYVATYYHLGKLLERVGDQEGAISTYAAGMEVAKTANDGHTLSELRSAWEELVY